MRGPGALGATALAVLATGLFVVGCGGSHRTSVSDQDPSTYKGAPIVGNNVEHDFALRDQNGAVIRLSAQRGHWVLLTFLYTHCTDVCPLIAGNLNTAVHALGPTADVRLIAVSVDPIRDTRAAVKSFIREHRLVPQFHYLMGGQSELERIWIAYNVVARASPTGKLVHSDYTYLIDPGGRLRMVYGPPAYSETIERDLRKLMA